MEYQYLYDHPKLNSVLRTLVQAFIDGEAPPENVVKQRYAAAAWAASSLSISPEPLHKKKAFLFASLSKKIFAADSKVDVLCYAIFARTGNIPSTKHLSFLLQEKDAAKHLIGALELEFIESYTNSISMFSENLTLTEFQAKVEASLVKDVTGLFTAPTSAGKSFIIHEYVKYKLNQNEPFLCVFIIPTKALISQFSSIYRNFRLEQDLPFEVFTSVPDGLVVDKKKAIFCLTQERCIKLLSSELRGNLSFIFVDEIQKVEDKGRGALLEYIINELQRYSPEARMFFAGPYISNAAALSKTLNLKVDQPIETEDSPVSQMVLLVKPVRNQTKLNLTLLANNEKDKGVSFSYDVGKKYYSRWRTQTTAITDAIDIFSSDSPSIAYAPGPGTARNWAYAYASKTEKKENLNSDLVELIEYVKESIHPQCSLIYCLEREVAFHHGKLPDFVREEIEDLFSTKVVDILFCTSTLLEGVNLPADKIFVIKPSKGDEVLSLFEFRNLIGRAGRLSDHLNGVVYCIHTSGEEDDWLNDYKDFDNSPVETFVDNSLKIYFGEVQYAIDHDVVLLKSMDDNELRNTLTILRSRFLIDEEFAEEYLCRKAITDEQRFVISASLKKSVGRLLIPAQLAERNPYIDPILQDKLYRLVLKSPMDWTIRRQTGFSIDFTRIFTKLDEIFNIVNECRPHSNFDFQGEIIVKYARYWLNGKPFSEIVRLALPKKYKRSPDVPYKEVDKAVQRAMEYITSDVSFVMTKYFSVLSEILKYILGEDELEMFSFTIGLPVMLELGSRDPKQLSLITACVPRGVALKIADIIPDVDDPIEWLTANQNREDLKRLPRLYKRILRRVGIWK